MEKKKIKNVIKKERKPVKSFVRDKRGKLVFERWSGNIYCADCWNMVNKKDLIKVGNKKVCLSCYKKNYVKKED